ncbi:hypothetical protein FHQ18_09530 [Deferribacter autotrophicus]|uniref:Uncharacterized protein n=1 Tax=Deferribacter autotrophicus TaxID=500465 RepID=A0A5A8F128_9BACT|nr:hypothetical protein [Deferribacter autotrophicus]KAA0257571.1 hypothetical protein FHQ18_09530 [Deferribacter autotrophicus]
MLPGDDVRLKIKNHNIKHLSESVQKFYNGPSCEIIIDNKENLDEIINLFKYLISENKNDFV